MFKKIAEVPTDETDETFLDSEEEICDDENTDDISFVQEDVEQETINLITKWIESGALKPAGNSKYRFKGKNLEILEIDRNGKIEMTFVLDSSLIYSFADYLIDMALNRAPQEAFPYDQHEDDVPF